jgi:uncharacterized protein
MLLLLSPAKTLDFAPAPDWAEATTPEMLGDTAKLAAVTRKLSQADLRRLMDISEALAELNVQRFRSFQPRSQGGVQAALAFAGDVYDGLQARTLDQEGLAWAQDHLRILSGLYGLLRPLDLIQPYRLEMGTRLPTERGANLYDFWGDRIAKSLKKALKDHLDPTVVNLASQEYFGAVDVKALKAPVLTCQFKEEKDGDLRVISFYAKIARGLMARYAIDQRLERTTELRYFEEGGYCFSAELSNPAEWVFVRPQPMPKAAAA